MPKPPAFLPSLRTTLDWRWLCLNAGVVLVVFAVAVASPHWPVFHPQTAPLWAAMGVGLAALVRGGLGLVPAVFLGLFLALWQGAMALNLSLALALGASAGLALAARTLQLTAFDPALLRRRDVHRLLGAVVGGAFVAAVAGEAGLWLWGSEVRPAPLAMFLQWWAADAVGMLLVAVPLLTLRLPNTRLARLARPGRDAVVLALIALACGGLAFAARRSGHETLWLALAYVPHLLLAGLVRRVGIAIASWATFALGLAAIVATGYSFGPFAALAPESAFPLLWGYVVTLLAITLLVHALASELRLLEARWRLALDGTGLGVAEWRLDRHDNEATAQWQALLGSESGAPERWLSQVYPDDHPALLRALEQLRAGQVQSVQQELRVRGDEGWRWLELRLLTAERDAKGRAVRLVATAEETSSRRDALERERLSASLFQHLHEGLLITDAELRVLDANPAYSQILGVPRHELMGTVPSLLRPAPPDPLARQQRSAMWDSLRATGGWRGEFVERRRSGEACTLAATISTVKGPDGALKYHVLVISDITESRLQRDRLERQAHFDELTRLPNRARLQELLAAAMRAADGDGYLLVVCYIDLDRFKPVNDRFGHAAGDRLLVELAGRLRGTLRSNEIWSDAAGRIGGDEFVLLLRAATMEEARLAVQRVLRVVTQPYVIDVALDPVLVTASLGATVYPLDHSDADTLLRHADHAMYGAKQAGRNGYQFFDPEHRRRTEERVMAIGRVQEALDRDEFLLYYQPKVDMRSGRVLGMEALLRWNHPQHGLIAPLQFVPLIENTGLSARIGDWVIGQALDHLAQWRRDGLDLSVSVNVTARHLQETDFAQRLSELLARHAEPLATSLELEILETAAQADIDATSELLTRCRSLGVRFALDDFGTGYSTLSYLKRLPVDVLKIDRSFVHHMLDDAQDRAIVEGVIGLARTFQCVVVAEGVESPAQARTLLDLGCNIGQGTGIAMPMPAATVAGWVREYRGLFALAAAGTPGATVYRIAGQPGE